MATEKFTPTESNWESLSSAWYPGLPIPENPEEYFFTLGRGLPSNQPKRYLVDNPVGELVWVDKPVQSGIVYVTATEIPKPFEVPGGLLPDVPAMFGATAISIKKEVKESEKIVARWHTLLCSWQPSNGSDCGAGAIVATRERNLG